MKRIRYVSSMAKPFTEDEVQKLVELAQKHNKQKGITGMLVAAGNKFYQLIEGPGGAIDALYKRIEKDPRHTDVKLLSAESGDMDRLYPNWSMLKVDLSLVEHEKLAPIQTLLNKAVSQRELLDDALSTLEECICRVFTDDETAEDDN
ncbi:MAG: hypothetical protein C0623_14420 [Desulfuromonas sp.]|nr:MAG: hypothetical protein C0623_14420 [Desulfuromonas sp.]